MTFLTLSISSFSFLIVSKFEKFESLNDDSLIADHYKMRRFTVFDASRNAQASSSGCSASSGPQSRVLFSERKGKWYGFLIINLKKRSTFFPL